MKDTTLFAKDSFVNRLIDSKRIALIGCSKTKVYRYERKRGGRAFPAETYGGQLWNARVSDCESRGVPWCVLSAMIVVWRMDEELCPTDGMDENRKPQVYDLTLDQLSKSEYALWVSRAMVSICQLLSEPWHQDESAELSPNEITIEFHAGKKYSNVLAKTLSAVGFNVELPTKGLAIGKQLQWYSNHNRQPRSVLR